MWRIFGADFPGRWPGLAQVGPLGRRRLPRWRVGLVCISSAKVQPQRNKKTPTRLGDLMGVYQFNLVVCRQDLAIQKSGVTSRVG